MITECIPGAASVVKVTDARANPAVVSPSRYSAWDRRRRCSRRRNGGSAVNRRQAILGHHVGDTDPPAGDQDAKHLREHGGLVGRQVDHAVGDHHIHRRIRQRQGLDLALEELHVRCTCLGGIGASQSQHVIGHVHPIGEPGRADPPCGQQDVDAAAGAQVQHPLALMQIRDSQRVTAAQASQDRLLRKTVRFALAIQRAEAVG